MRTRRVADREMYMTGLQWLQLGLFSYVRHHAIKPGGDISTKLRYPILLRCSRSQLSMFLLCAFVVSEVLAQPCEDDLATAEATKFLADLTSGNCEAFASNQYWLNKCNQLTKGPAKEMYAEFNRRTKTVVSSIVTKDNTTYAVLEISGPEVTSFQLALNRESYCLSTHDAIWPSMTSKTGCGDKFWQSIPTVNYLGALKLECRDKKWMVLDAD